MPRLVLGRGGRCAQRLVAHVEHCVVPRAVLLGELRPIAACSLGPFQQHVTQLWQRVSRRLVPYEREKGIHRLRPQAVSDRDLDLVDTSRRGRCRLQLREKLGVLSEPRPKGAAPKVRVLDSGGSIQDRHCAFILALRPVGRRARALGQLPNPLPTPLTARRGEAAGV